MSSVTRGAVLRPIYHLFESGTLVGWSDVQLLDRFVASRDEAAFESLVIRHGRSVWRSAVMSCATRMTPRTPSRPRS